MFEGVDASFAEVQSGDGDGPADGPVAGFVDLKRSSVRMLLGQHGACSGIWNCVLVLQIIFRALDLRALLSRSFTTSNVYLAGADQWYGFRSLHACFPARGDAKRWLYWLIGDMGSFECPFFIQVSEH